MNGVFLGTPVTRDLSVAYVTSLWMTKYDGLMHWQPTIGQAIDIARNQVVSCFLNTDYEFLLMHDSDASWHPEAVMRLAERNLPAVTGVIFSRDLPTVPTIGIYAGVDPSGYHTYSWAHTLDRLIKMGKDLPPDFKNEWLFDKHKDDIEEIDGAGAHFMLIRRDVLEKTEYPWYQCSSINAGEDFYFCRKIKETGFKLYVDYSVLTGHSVGPGLEIGMKQFLMFTDKKRNSGKWRV